ncbi:MAG: discoidin domain-containing protein, partial [Oscillospiraceae bacterium]|nr:discoidin domain-containing protein [Oscillospiraceae bacterium]
RYLTPTDMRRDLEALLDGRSIGVSSLDKTVGIFGNRSTATTEAPAEKPSPSDVTEPDSKTASYCAEPLPSVSAAETVGIFHGGGNFVITPEPKTVKDHVGPQRNAPEKRVQPQPAPNVRNVPPPPPPKVASTKKSSSLTPFLCIAIVLLIAVGVAGYALISSGSSGDLIHNGSTSPSGNYAGSDDPTSAPNANAGGLHASEYLGDPSGLTRIWFKSATASSQIYSEGILYSAENAIDNSTSTSWQEDADDDGEGEYLTLFFDGDTSIKYVSILPGYAKSTSAYYRNNRPKDILIEFSDGRSCTYTLPDGMSYATLALNDTVTTSYIRITILSVYKGETWDDTAITEVIAYR